MRSTERKNEGNTVDIEAAIDYCPLKMKPAASIKVDYKHLNIKCPEA
ncbi:hypothetical protein Psfp_02738 [Pelotomaculum sp. FP]|nr:hypothetical protein [Pelotomaculum sp. FP]TEB14693.1 hypothetical protein Psfp_02738 [Pelotomaculum sp. FP]